eukprot:ANDGO_02668.mRNA.1 Nucleus export protein brr6
MPVTFKKRMFFRRTRRVVTDDDEAHDIDVPMRDVSDVHFVRDDCDENSGRAKNTSGNNRRNARRAPNVYTNRMGEEEEQEDDDAASAGSDNDEDGSVGSSIVTRAFWSIAYIPVAICAFLSRVLYRVFTLPLHPDAPRVVGTYAQMSFHIGIFALFGYVFYLLYASVQHDVELRVDEFSQDVLTQIGECQRQWRENRCDDPNRPPVLATTCALWEQCMRRDPRMVARTRISAETVATIINSFVEPLSTKTILVGLSALMVAIVGSTWMLRSWQQSSPPVVASSPLPALVSVPSPVHSYLQPPRLQLSPEDIRSLATQFSNSLTPRSTSKSAASASGAYRRSHSRGHVDDSD